MLVGANENRKCIAPAFSLTLLHNEIWEIARERERETWLGCVDWLVLSLSWSSVLFYLLYFHAKERRERERMEAVCGFKGNVHIYRREKVWVCSLHVDTLN
jgi:hypothetical protein